MRRIVFCLLSYTLIMFSSCSKRNANIGLAGKWNIIYDSSYTGVGLGNHAVNYRGKIGDYFDFGPDNKLYTREGNIVNTLDYSMVTNSTTIISSFGIILNGTQATTFIKNLTAHHVTLLSPFFATPGGIFGRSVQLSR